MIGMFFVYAVCTLVLGAMFMALGAPAWAAVACGSVIVGLASR